MTFFIALFILLMQFLWKYVDDLVGKGLEWHIIVRLLGYSSTTFVPLALPLAMLLSSLMTFGNLGENYELVAFKSAGISLRRIMMPIAVFAFIVSGIAFYFSNNILPLANLKSLSLLHDVRTQKPAINIQPGIFYNDIDGYVIRVEEKEKDDQTIRDVIIYDHTDNMGNTNVTVAEWGKMKITPDKKHLTFRLFNGYNYEEKTENYPRHHYTRKRPFQRTKFKEQYIRFDLSSFAFKKTNEEFFKKNYQMLNLFQLQEARDSIAEAIQDKRDNFAKSLKYNLFFYSKIDTLPLSGQDTIQALAYPFLANYNDEDRKQILEMATRTARNVKENIHYHIKDFEVHEKRVRKHEIEWHKKFTLSMACLLLFFIGAPLGAIIRKGGLGLPVVVSVLFFVIFWVINISSEKSVKQGVIAPEIGMWISSLFLLPIGIFLTYKATSDSPLMDSDAWKKLFMGFRFRKRKNRK